MQTQKFRKNISKRRFVEKWIISMSTTGQNVKIIIKKNRRSVGWDSLWLSQSHSFTLSEGQGICHMMMCKRKSIGKSLRWLSASVFFSVSKWSQFGAVCLTAHHVIHRLTGPWKSHRKKRLTFSNSQIGKDVNTQLNFACFNYVGKIHFSHPIFIMLKYGLFHSSTIIFLYS